MELGVCKIVSFDTSAKTKGYPMQYEWFGANIGFPYLYNELLFEGVGTKLMKIRRTSGTRPLVF